MPGNPGFTEDQKQYLEGFIAGIAKKRGIALPNDAAAQPAAQPIAESTDSPPINDPTVIHRLAQDRAVAAGGTLVPEELAKRTKNPFDMWDEIAANAAAGRFPKGTDVFLHKFHGLFYVAPNQDSFMLRLRLPGGILSAHQAKGLADIAERFGAGADNIRNLTGSPLAGIDPQELIDTRPLTRALYHHILNHRELYGLPRKFNIAFDGGGRVGVLEDTNDIGFAAVRIGPGKPVP